MEGNLLQQGGILVYPGIMPVLEPLPLSLTMDRLREVLPALRREFPLRRLGVFGSVARGEAGPESDIDILVEVDSSIGLGFVTLAERLEAELGRKVDLVSRRALKPGMWESIQQELIDAEA
jgi:predicted nucleotidyltransferase